MGKKNHILVIALLANEFFNNIILVGISLRIIVLLVLTLIALKSVDLRKLRFNNYLLSLYFLYVFVTLAATLFSGNFNLDGFLRKFFGYYTITLLYTIIIPNIKITIQSYEKVINFIVTIGVVHLSLIVLQYLGLDMFWSIPGWFSSDFAYLGNGMYKYSRKLNQISPVGLIDFTVTSGYLNLIFVPFYKYFKRNIYKIIFVCLLLISSLLLGQRSVLVILIAYLLFDIFVKRNGFQITVKGIFISLVSMSIIYIALSSSYVMDTVSYKFQRNLLDDENRLILLTAVQSFFMSNFWVGGLIQYMALLETKTIAEITLPHNVFLNSFVMGGIFSLITSIWLFTSYFKYLWKNYKLANRSITFYPLFMSCLLIMLNSLFHNQGFSTNDNSFFLLFGLANIKVIYEN